MEAVLAAQARKGAELTEGERTAAYVFGCGEQEASVLVEEIPATEYWARFPGHQGLTEAGLIAIMNIEMADSMRLGVFLPEWPNVELRRKCKMRETPEFKARLLFSGPEIPSPYQQGRDQLLQCAFDDIEKGRL